MNLAHHQRILLGLMRSSYQVGADDEDYFHRVSASRDLEEARGNVLLWRVYVLERTCVLTVALLRQRQCLLPMLQAFIRQENISPFREFQPRAFLVFASASEDHLIASVAQFELALGKVSEGDSDRFVVPWSVDPHTILKALAEGTSVNDVLPPEPHATIVDRALPGSFAIERLDLH
jgi:hypothetical protein